MKNFRPAIGLLILVLVAVAIYGGFQVFPNGKPSGVHRQSVTKVVTGFVEQKEFADQIDVMGSARSNESITVTSKVTEIVARINFEDGQIVGHDDILVELTDDEQLADLDEARASFTEAEQQYERINDLVKRGAGTRSSLESAIAKRDQAKARMAAIEARMADRLIRAPFSGVLGLRLVSPGSLVKPGDVITTLDDISLIKFDFSVPEAYLGSLEIGSEIKARAIAFPDREFVGKVSAIDTRLDPQTRAIKVRAEVANEDGALKPGMLLTAELLGRVKTSMAISDEALVQRENQHFVYVLTETEKGLIVERRVIIIGRRSLGLVEVLDGLSLGEEIVVEGTNTVSSGRRVERVTPVGTNQKGVPAS